MKQLFVVKAEIPFAHVLEVGIQADSQEQAMREAHAWFSSDDLDDTAETPLLMNGWQESESPMVLSAREIEGEEFPPPHVSVEKEYQKSSAMMACKLLVDALEGVAEGGSINMRHLAMAMKSAEFALKEL